MFGISSIARKVSIKSKERDIIVTVDGEPIGILPGTFQVHPNALNSKILNFRLCNMAVLLADRISLTIQFGIHFTKTVYSVSFYQIRRRTGKVICDSEFYIVCFPTGKGDKNRTYASVIPLDVPGGP